MKWRFHIINLHDHKLIIKINNNLFPSAVGWNFEVTIPPVDNYSPTWIWIALLQHSSVNWHSNNSKKLVLLSLEKPYYTIIYNTMSTLDPFFDEVSKNKFILLSSMNSFPCSYETYRLMMMINLCTPIHDHFEHQLELKLWKDQNFLSPPLTMTLVYLDFLFYFKSTIITWWYHKPKKQLKHFYKMISQ